MSYRCVRMHIYLLTVTLCALYKHSHLCCVLLLTSFFSWPLYCFYWTNEPRCAAVPSHTFTLDFAFLLASLKPLVETVETLRMCACLYEFGAPNPHLLWIIDLLNLGRMGFVCREAAAAAGRQLTVCFKRQGYQKVETVEMENVTSQCRYRSLLTWWLQSRAMQGLRQ